MSCNITLIGRIAKDPDTRYTPGGTAIFSCSVPVQNYMSKKGYDGQEKPCPEGWKESYNKKGWEYVQWWRVTVFGARAKTCIDHLSKGDWVHFEGRMAGTVVDGVMNPTVWAGRDGAQHASYELVANDVEFLGKSADGGSRASQASDIDDIDPQNIPF